MTHQERPTPDGGAPQASRLSACPALSVAADRSEETACLWPDLYHRASPEQRQQLLQRAGQEGVLQAQHLAGLAAVSPAMSLSALLQGPAPELIPVPMVPFTPIDSALDPTQREAVARALATPDFCLIQGWPGTGKSRVAAEVIRQTAQRGQRVLLLAPNPAGLDRILEQLAGQDAICALRCLDPGEKAEALPADVRALTLAARGQQFQEQTLGQARQALVAARQRLEHQQQVQVPWPQLEQLADRAAELAEQVRNLQVVQAGILAAVEAEAAGAAGAADPTPFQVRLFEQDTAFSGRLAELEARLATGRAEAAKIQAEQDSLEREQADLEPLSEARQKGQWWGPRFWQGLFQGAESRLHEVQRRLAELEQAGQRQAAEEAALGEERGRLEQQHHAERSQLLQQEQGRRQAELVGRLQQVAQDQQRLTAEWQELIRPLAPETELPAVPERGELRASRERWQRRLAESEQELARAQQWLTDVEEAARSWPQHLIPHLNLVAATPAAQARDPLFGEQANGRLGGEARPFDLLLLDDAEQVSEADFQTLAPRARRWVLLGTPPADEPANSRERKPASRPSNGSPEPRAGFFAQLWARLHTDPRRWPYTWLLRQGRLCCRLHAVPSDQERWVQTESVADQPDIELRILSVPRSRPVLAEVLFPQAMSIHQAKEYLYRELEELTVQAETPCLRWLERPGQIVLRLALAELPETRPVPLEYGVREMVGPRPADAASTGEDWAPWQTCCLEFDCTSGWDRDKAERWLESRLDLRNLGRTVLLTTPQRWQPGLAHWVADLASPPLMAGDYDGPPAVDFVMVPPAQGLESRRHSESEGRRRQGGTATATARPRTGRGGAGLEIDLSSPLRQGTEARRSDPLPAELRSVLPAQGLVNFPEAQAVVRAIEVLLADPTILAEASCWQQRLCGLPARHPALAVMALYPAQVELIRCLLRRASLPATALRLEVGLPLAFRQRECHTALVSLTRSHTHRAVAFGDSPDQLVLALTRPAGRLILFGDPGTLARRSQWPGAVDHLDDLAAGRERRLISRLVQSLQGAGAAAPVFRVHESGSL